MDSPSPTGGSVKACNKGGATGLDSGISFWGTLRSYPSRGAPEPPWVPPALSKVDLAPHVPHKPLGFPNLLGVP